MLFSNHLQSHASVAGKCPDKMSHDKNLTFNNHFTPIKVVMDFEGAL